MKRIYIYFSVFLAGIVVLPFSGFAQIIDGDAMAVITTRNNKRIPPQQYLSREIALKRPMIVKGKITDRGGEPIPSVMVCISNLLDYESIQSTTDNDGMYRIELPANDMATTYKMSIKFLSGEFEFSSNKIFAEKAYQVSSKFPSTNRASNSMCLNELIYLADKNTKLKAKEVTLVLNIAHQKESVLTKKPIEAAKDIVESKLNPSIPVSIKERLIARFEELRMIYPRELPYFEALGILQYELKSLPDRNYRKAAINRFRAAVKLGSANMEVYHKLIDLLSEVGFYGESIQVAVRILELIGDDPEKLEDRQEFEWLIRRAQFQFKEKEKEKEFTEEEKKLRNEWSLTLIENQREVYRRDGYPNEIKTYERREGVQQEWWYYNKGACYIFLNGMLNTKREF